MTAPASLLVLSLKAANRYPIRVSGIVWVLMTLPAAFTACASITGSLGPNPLEQIIRQPGKWALIFLLLVLTLTPLRQALVKISRRLGWSWGRRMADWNWLIRLRRHIGLASFFYASGHVVLYGTFDLGWDWHEFVEDAGHKPFVLAGVTAIVLLTPLAITSTDAWMRRLKRNWKRLHWLIYPAALFAVLHFIWLSKPGMHRPYAYAAVLVVLLGYRVVMRRKPEAAGKSALGEEVPERKTGGTDQQRLINDGF